MKKHFSYERWIDFVRRLLPPAEHERMREHLDDGCERCNKTCNILEAAVEVTTREVLYQPSEPVVNVAKGYYATARRKYLVPSLAKMIPLAFDSSMEASPAAVRAPGIAYFARRLLYRTKSWTVDVRLERQSGTLVSMIGQVLRARGKPAAGAVAEVILMRADSTLAQVHTNEFGEFHLQFQYENNLKVYLKIQRRQLLGIALPSLDT